ncbi:MAG: DUF4241 domain-containing protein [Nannocystaceae bacterium]
MHQGDDELPEEPRHTDFELAFDDGAAVEGAWDEPWTIRVIELGALTLRSGRVVVGDPLTGALASDDALARRVPPGRYPVQLSVIAASPEDHRVAAAKLVVRDAPVVRWEPALFEGQAPDAARLPCYGVDSGTGVFACADAAPPDDEASAERLLEALDADADGLPGLGACPHPVAPEAAICFSTGWGDGLYVSWWGVAADGEPSCLVTDFDLLVRTIFERVVVAWPPKRGRVSLPQVAAREGTLWRPLLGTPRLRHRGPRPPRVRLLAPGEAPRPIPPRWVCNVAEYAVDAAPVGAQLEIAYPVGERPARRLAASPR